MTTETRSSQAYKEVIRSVDGALGEFLDEVLADAEMAGVISSEQHEAILRRTFGEF